MQDYWPDYDPTIEALLFPERRHPYGLHASEDGWPEDAVCAEFARLAYVRFEDGYGRTIAAAMAKAGFGPPKFFPAPRALPDSRSRPRRLWDWFFDPNAQAFGATSLDGALTIVAFRGTQANAVQDILVDLRARAVTWDGPGRVHKGFWKAYQSLRGQIDAWLGSVPAGRLIVTGHSLGGAMATLMAALQPRSELITFGSPRVGDSAFLSAFAGRVPHRYVDCTDGVTWVPPELLGYRHVEGLRYIDRQGAVQEIPPDPAAIERDQREAKRIYDATYAGQRGNVPRREGADHAPVNYISAIAGLR